MKKKVLFLSISILLASCVRDPLKINVSNVSVDLIIKHFDVDLLKIKPEQMQSAIPELKKSYNDFFDIFTYRMISIGGIDQANFSEMLNSFIADTLIRDLESDVATKIDTIRIGKEILDAFKHYRYYFPQKEIPVIYTCISGFNQSVVISKDLVGISLDKYLGASSPFYVKLGLPEYKRKNMYSSRIVPDVMYGWAAAEWPKDDKSNNLLSQMIQEGKLMYFMDAMLPELNDSLKMGYSEDKLDYCRENEAKMWTFLAEQKLLFTTDRMSIKRFIDDGPYTSAFGQSSPARTGVWLGWQIVRSYMKENKEVKLSELMDDSDFQSILNHSGYQPR